MGTSSRRATRPSSRCSWPWTSRTARYHDVMAAAEDLGGMPVVVADLHSAVPAVVAGVRAERPGARVAYVMTDGGALPLAFSRTVSTPARRGLACRDRHRRAGLRRRPRGGQPALRPARGGARAACRRGVVAQGPGNVGTGTPWGFSGVAAGEALNAAGTLGGRARRLAARLGRRMPARGTGASRTTAPRHTAGSRWCRRTVPVPRLDRGVRRARRRSRRTALAEATGGRLRCARSPSTASTPRCDSLRCGCRPWAVGSRRTRAVPRGAAAGRYAAGAGTR